MPLTSDFWENERRRLLAIFLPRMTQMALTGMATAARQAGISFDSTLYNQRAEAWARQHTDELLEEFIGNSKTVQGTFVSGVGSAVADWIAKPGATVGDLNEALTAYGASRANAIAVTETTRAFANGQIEAYIAEGIDEIIWSGNKDDLVCPICGPLQNKRVKIGTAFGKDRKGNDIFQPPAHPRCRCWIRPGVSKNRPRKAPEEVITQIEQATAQAVETKLKFVEAKSLEDANKYARDVLGLKFADYKGTDIKTANKWNQAVFETLERMPELKAQTKAVGTAQAMRSDLVEFITQKVLEDKKDLWTNRGLSDEEQLKLAKSWAQKSVKKTSSNTYAVSWSKTPNDTDGIFINNKWNVDKLEPALKRDVETGWHPTGTDWIKAVVDHEFGHQVDTLVGLRNNAEISMLYNSLSKSEIETGLSRYPTSKETKDKIKAEFIAEAWSEYLNNPAPRPIAQKVGDLILKLYNEKYGK